MEMRERKGEARPPEGRRGTAAPPLPAMGGRRSRPPAHYRAPFHELIAPGERGSKGESNLGPCAAGEGPERAAPWPAAMNPSGERGQGTRKPQFAREKDGERARGEGSSPAQRWLGSGWARGGRARRFCGAS